VGVHSIKRYDLLLRLERVPRAERTSQRTPRELDSFNSPLVSLVSFSGRTRPPLLSGWAIPTAHLFSLRVIAYPGAIQTKSSETAVDHRQSGVRRRS